MPPAPVQVVSAVVAALNSRDAEASLRHFDERAVVQQPTRWSSFSGPEQIRVWVGNGISDGRLLAVPSGYEASGDRIAWTARVSSAPMRRFGIDDLDMRIEAIVRDGRVVLWTESPDPVGAQRTRAALSAAAEQTLSARIAQVTAESAVATQVAEATKVAGSGVLQRVPSTQERSTPSIGAWAAAAAAVLATAVAAALRGSRAAA